MKERILKLRAEGKTYDEIQSILGCSKSTISYHCGIGQKEKNNGRSNINRAKPNIKNYLRGKIDSFNGSAFADKKKRENGGSITVEDAIDVLIKQENKCYLTGEELNLADKQSLNFDHIIPSSKGGNNNKENLGIAIKSANLAKSDLTIDEFLELCKKVLIHHGYTVNK